MTKFVTEEILKSLKHEVLQNLINPDDESKRHGVVHEDVGSQQLADAPYDKPLLLTTPLEFDGYDTLHGYIKKKHYPDIRGNYLKYQMDLLNQTEPTMIELVVPLFALNVPEGLIGATELKEPFILTDTNKSSEVITLEGTTVNDKKIFEGMNLEEEMVEVVDENYDYIEPDFGTFLEDFNPHASTLVPVMEEVGRPFATKNVSDLSDLKLEHIGYVENSDKATTGFTTLAHELADGVVLSTGSVLYKISHEAALALAHNEIKEHRVLPHYFFSPLAWYIPIDGETNAPVEISFKVFGVESIEGIYMADFDTGYQTIQVSGEPKDITMLGISPKPEYLLALEEANKVVEVDEEEEVVESNQEPNDTEKKDEGTDTDVTTDEQEDKAENPQDVQYSLNDI